MGMDVVPRFPMLVGEFLAQAGNRSQSRFIDS